MLVWDALNQWTKPLFLFAEEMAFEHSILGGNLTRNLLIRLDLLSPAPLHVLTAGVLIELF